jgi:hypothetical protein
MMAAVDPACPYGPVSAMRRKESPHDATVAAPRPADIAASERQRATEYRRRALECLQRAADISNRFERQSLLGLADAFNRLAEHVTERRN